MKITLFDTSVCTENLGDFIIMEAVRDQIDSLFPDAMILHTTTHDKISRPSYKICRNSNFAFVGGTNLLTSNMNKYNQWRINLVDSFFLKQVILMGVGWWQYQSTANWYTKYLLNKVLNRDVLHSVRDSHTEKMLNEAGFNNVINTSCPTMWNLDRDHCAKVPRKKANNVVTTLTDYNKDRANDLGFIKLLTEMYENVFLWPQGSGDIAYFADLGIPASVDVLPPKLTAFDSLLESDLSLDFVGTRLHAGVRALQKKRRAIILGIDNRAFEKAQDFNIVVCERGQLRELKDLIQSEFSTDISIPTNNIEKWKSQFR